MSGTLQWRTGQNIHTRCWLPRTQRKSMCVNLHIDIYSCCAHRHAFLQVIRYVKYPFALKWLQTVTYVVVFVFGW